MISESASFDGSRTRKVASRGIAFAAVALAIGCGGTTPAPMDGGGTLPMLPAATRGTIGNPTEAPSAYGCTGSAPAPGIDIPVNFDLIYFGGTDGAPEARIWFFPDNVVQDTCVAPLCQEVMTDLDGRAMVTARANGWYAYRVFGRDDLPTSATRFAGSFQYNEPAPAAAGGMVEGNAVSEQTLALIPAVLGFPRTPGTTLLAGTVLDCDGNPVHGAIPRAFGPDGVEIAEGPRNMDPHYRFFNGDSTPDGERTYTHVDGLFAGVNIPVSASPADLVRVEAWGSLDGTSPPMRLGCEAIRVFADEVTIVNIGPMRSDDPADHPCAP